jgi:hypothetical protein
MSEAAPVETSAEGVGGLIIRRTTEEKGNKIAVRLDPAVDRTVDLYELFRDGFLVEVVDTEVEEDRSKVTLRIQAAEAFKVDRVEKICKPREDEELGLESVVALDEKANDELRAMSDEELEDYMAALRAAESSLKGKTTRMKLDKSKAGDRGYRHPNNDHYFRWLMINEELDILAEQSDRVMKAIQSANTVKKARLHAEHQARRSTFLDCFVQVAKESMAERTFEKLRKKAEAMAEGE